MTGGAARTRAREAADNAGRSQVFGGITERTGLPLAGRVSLPVRPLHIRIVRSAAALGYNPINVLLRVLDVAGLTVDTVLRVDLEPRLVGRGVADDLVYARRTI